MSQNSCHHCGCPIGIIEHGAPDLLFRTDDHPEANGRKPRVGESQYILQFELEDGRALRLELGEKAFQLFTQFLMDMLSNVPSYRDDSLAEKLGAPPVVEALRIGKFGIFQRASPDTDKVWIETLDGPSKGDGGEFPKAKLEKVLDAFFAENF